MAEVTIATQRGARIVNIGYHEPSAQDAHRRIVAFFNTHPNSEPPAPTESDRGGAEVNA